MVRQSDQEGALLLSNVSRLGNRRIRAPNHQDPHYRDQEQIEAGKREWNEKIGILEKQLLSTAALLVGDVFTLADIVVGLSVNRWLKTPLERPAYPAVMAYYEMLSERPAFLEHGLNKFP